MLRLYKNDSRNGKSNTSPCMSRVVGHTYGEDATNTGSRSDVNQYILVDRKRRLTRYKHN